MSLIQIPDLGIRLKEFLGLTELPDQVLAPEMVAVIQVADLSAGGGGLPSLGGATRAAVAAERQTISLSSPVAAGNLRPKILVKDVTIASNADTSWTLAITGAAYTPDTISGDKRWADLDGEGRPSAQVGSDSRAAGALPAVGIIGHYRTLANTSLRIPLNLSLGTRVFQNHLLCLPSSDQITVNISFRWTEFLS